METTMANITVHRNKTQSLVLAKVTETVGIGSVNLTGPQRKMVNALWYTAQQEMKRSGIEERKYFSIPFDEFRSLIGWENCRQYSKIKALARAITSAPVDFDVLNKGRREWHCTNLVSSVIISQSEETGETIVKYDLPIPIIEMLYNVEAPFLKLILHRQAVLSGKYAIDLYENLADWAHVGILDVPIKKLAKIIGVPENKTDQGWYIKKCVKRAIEEINKAPETCMYVTWKTESKKNRLLKAIFSIKDFPNVDEKKRYIHKKPVNEIETKTHYWVWLKHKIGSILPKLPKEQLNEFTEALTEIEKNTILTCSTDPFKACESGSINALICMQSILNDYGYNIPDLEAWEPEETAGLPLFD